MSTQMFERNRIRTELVDELDDLRGGDIIAIAKRLSLVDGRQKRLLAIAEGGHTAIIKHQEAFDYGIYAIGAGGTLSQRDRVGTGSDAEAILEEYAGAIDWVAPEWR